MKKMTKTACIGCRDNFYNGNNTLGVKECVMYPTAIIVVRWAQDWHTRSDAPGAFMEVEVPSCYNRPGNTAYVRSLPSCAVEPIRLRRRGSRL